MKSFVRFVNTPSIPSFVTLVHPPILSHATYMAHRYFHRYIYLRGMLHPPHKFHTNHLHVEVSLTDW